VGTIELVEETMDDGTFANSIARVNLGDEVTSLRSSLVFVMEAGDCQYYEAFNETRVCTPECAAEMQWCDPDGECRKVAQAHSAGPVTFGGLLIDLVATPSESASGLVYYTFGDFPGADLFNSDSNITVSAPGDSFPSFSVELSGVDDLTVGWSSNLEFVDGDDNVVSWTPSGASSSIELIIQTGFHGDTSDATIWCTAPDSQGEIVIPQQLVEMYPLADGSLGKTQHVSHLRRVQRKVSETTFGPVEISTKSQYTFNIRH
jgi:hypothetical protein